MEMTKQSSSKEFEFYTLDEIEKRNARYYMIFGERGNGKTSAVLERILRRWWSHGEQGAYIRRYDVDITGSRADEVYSSIANERKLVEEVTGGEWDSIVYWSRKWYLAKYDPELNKYIKQHKPFCYAFAINQSEQHKGTAFPFISTICYDEFMSREHPLPDEFVRFCSLLSTIIRQRDNVIVYMLGNTVNKYSLYFKEMGITNARKMEQGTIDVYEYGESRELRVAVEYCGTQEVGKKSDVYFAFDNPKLNMITSGTWELPLYPHSPYQIKKEDVLEVFFIRFHENLLQGNIVLMEDSLFIYVHEKTTKLKDDDKMLYSLDFSPKMNHAVSLISKPRNKLSAKISELISNDLIYFSDNEVGDTVHNYIIASERLNSINL